MGFHSVNNCEKCNGYPVTIRTDGMHEEFCQACNMSGLKDGVCPACKSTNLSIGYNFMQIITPIVICNNCGWRNNCCI